MLSGSFVCIKVECETDEEDVGKKARSQLMGSLLGWGLRAESPSLRTIGTIHGLHSAALGWEPSCFNFVVAQMHSHLQRCLEQTVHLGGLWCWISRGPRRIIGFDLPKDVFLWSLGPLEISSCLLSKLKWFIFLLSVMEMKGWRCGSMGKQSCGITWWRTRDLEQQYSACLESSRKKLSM